MHLFIGQIVLELLPCIGCSAGVSGHGADDETSLGPCPQGTYCLWGGGVGGDGWASNKPRIIKCQC